MTYVIDESLNDTDYTANGSVGGMFGTPRQYLSITIHHWGSFGQTHMGVVNFFMKPNSPTSAHFVASDNWIHCLVSPQDAAWAAGNAYGNATSIHIECHPEATDGDYATVAWLVAYLRKYYGDLPLLPHNYWTQTSCPGIWDLDRVDRLARATTSPQSGDVTPIPTKDGFDMASLDDLANVLKRPDVVDAIATAVLAKGVPWQGKDGKGSRDNTSLQTFLSWNDADNTWIRNLITASTTAVKAISTVQPVALSDAQVATIADQLKASLPAATVAALAAKLS